MNMEKELDRSAIHEAGHAMICLEMEVGIDNATIIPDIVKKNVGSVTRKENIQIDFNDKSLSNLELLKQEVMILLGGYVALQKATDSQIGEGSSMDWVEAFCMADNFFNNSEVAGDFLKFCSCEVKKIFDSKWQSVESIANGLLNEKTLIGQDIIKLVGPIEPKS